MSVIQLAWPIYLQACAPGLEVDVQPYKYVLLPNGLLKPAAAPMAQMSPWLLMTTGSCFLQFHFPFPPVVSNFTLTLLTISSIPQTTFTRHVCQVRSDLLKAWGDGGLCSAMLPDLSPTPQRSLTSLVFGNVLLWDSTMKLNFPFSSMCNSLVPHLLPSFGVHVGLFTASDQLVPVAPFWLTEY